MNFLDIVIITTIVVGAFFGYMRGMLASLAGFISTLLGFGAASHLFLHALNWAEAQFPLRQGLEPLIYRLILPAVQAKVDSEIDQQRTDGILGRLPEDVRGMLETLIGPRISESVEEAARHFAGILTDRLLYLLAFVGVFCVTMVFLQLAFSIALSFFNKGTRPLMRPGGPVFGAAGVFIGLSIIAALFWPFYQADVGGTLMNLARGSLLYPYFLESFQMLDKAFGGQISPYVMEPIFQEKDLLLFFEDQFGKLMEWP